MEAPGGDQQGEGLRGKGHEDTRTTGQQTLALLPDSTWMLVETCRQWTERSAAPCVCQRMNSS